MLKDFLDTIFNNIFAVPLDFDFSEHPAYPFRLNLIQDGDKKVLPLLSVFPCNFSKCRN